MEEKVSYTKLGISSIILGLISLIPITGFLFGIFAFIFGLVDFKKNNSKLGVYGFILACIGILITLFSKGVVFGYLSTFHKLFFSVLLFIGILIFTLGTINFKDNKKYKLIKMIIGFIIILSVLFVPYGNIQYWMIILEYFGELIYTIIAFISCGPSLCA